MSKENTAYSASDLLKQHEGKLQQLRNERKAESRRLDDLKKILQTKMQAVRHSSNIHAA